jgi:hypothetical protein
MVGLAPVALAQQRRAASFDAMHSAIQSAKDAAGFEFSAPCPYVLLPQGGGENESDNVPNFVADPSSTKADVFSEPAKVFDNLYGRRQNSLVLGADDERRHHHRHDLSVPPRS